MMAYTLYAGIYKITCETNGKVYIGRSVQVPVRRKRHEYDLRDGIHTNLELQEDYNKFGKEAFSFELVKEVPRSISSIELDNLEKYYINKFNSFEQGYNMTEGGFGNTGRAFSDKTKEKMSSSMQGIPKSLEARKNISQGKKARMLIDGEYKIGVTETAKEMGIHRDTLGKRLRNPNFPNYIKLPSHLNEEEALKFISENAERLS